MTVTTTTTTTTTYEPHFSLVREFAAATPPVARAHFESKLAFETDPADLFADQQKGVSELVILDARSPEAFADEHIPGALNVPSRRISAETTAAFDRDRLIVTYCWGPGCNGSSSFSRSTRRRRSTASGGGPGMYSLVAKIGVDIDRW